jgi:hypothetical protein
MVDSYREDLAVGHSGEQFVELSGSIMEGTIVEGANPEIAVAAGDGSNVRRLQARVEGRKPSAVEYHESLAFGAEQYPSRAQHQHGRDGSQVRIRRENLAKARAIESQQPFAARRDKELRLSRSGGYPGGHRTKFGGRQFDACAIRTDRSAIPVV